MKLQFEIIDNLLKDKGYAVYLVEGNPHVLGIEKMGFKSEAIIYGDSDVISIIINHWTPAEFITVYERLEREIKHIEKKITKYNSIMQENTWQNIK